MSDILDIKIGVLNPGINPNPIEKVPTFFDFESDFTDFCNNYPNLKYPLDIYIHDRISSPLQAQTMMLQLFLEDLVDHIELDKIIVNQKQAILILNHIPYRLIAEFSVERDLIIQIIARMEELVTGMERLKKNRRIAFSLYQESLDLQKDFNAMVFSPPLEVFEEA